jgi:polyphosphate kinase
MQREDPMNDARDDKPEANGELKRKAYERELTRLHVEFVKLQQWVVHEGLKVCTSSKGATGQARAARSRP